MAFKMCMVLSTLAVVCFGQRAPYAGKPPIGFPIIETTTTTPSPSELGNRFNEGDADAPTTTTMRLPVEAMGDYRLVEFLSKLPVDQQPFWFLNWKAIEAQRQRPQTYDQRPNSFIDQTGINPQRWS